MRRVAMEKLDLKKKWRHLYQPSAYSHHHC